MELVIKWAPYGVVLLVLGGYLIYIAKTQPKRVKEWLINACAIAEQFYGAGTGKLKLRKVWAMFIEQFPILSNFVSFERFSGWVEEALAAFKYWIEKNPQAAEFFGENTGSSEDDAE